MYCLYIPTFNSINQIIFQSFNNFIHQKLNKSNFNFSSIFSKYLAPLLSNNLRKWHLFVQKKNRLQNSKIGFFEKNSFKGIVKITIVIVCL